MAHSCLARDANWAVGIISWSHPARDACCPVSLSCLPPCSPPLQRAPPTLQGESCSASGRSYGQRNGRDRTRKRGTGTGRLKEEEGEGMERRKEVFHHCGFGVLSPFAVIGPMQAVPQGNARMCGGGRREGIEVSDAKHRVAVLEY